MRRIEISRIAPLRASAKLAGGRISRSLMCAGLAATVCLSAAAALLRSSAAGTRQSAAALVESLDDQQKQQMIKPYDDPSRVAWHFIPMKSRKGVPLRDMNDAQRAASLKLLRSALSEVGYTKASQIMLMEQVLKALEGPDRSWPRDWQEYHVTLFGDYAADDAPWALSFEGHHLSLNFVFQGDRVLDSTPQFFGANPAVLRTDVEDAPLKKGTRILADEELLAFELVNTLSDAQRKKAIFAEEAPAEIRAAGEAQPPQDAPIGISYRELTAPQIALLERLISVYANAMPEEVVTERIAKIREAGWGNITFAWGGATEPGIGHYYRIQGPTFVIEFVNTQPDAEGNPANHIHCVWRDQTGDFNLN